MSTEQTTFMPSRYILDNVLILYEAIEWAKGSDQDMILLNLDFKKTYDTVHLPFLFKVMQALGVPPHVLRTIFVNTKATVGINGGESYSFMVSRGMRQSCLLAPYLFLFIGAAFNIATKAATATSELYGVMLQADVQEQLIIQYADDTHFIVVGTKTSF